ncbi:peptidoglycan DD-metalloendopeptidase family protein [Sphingomonas rhizophila]|uniref:Peptidoglycan DD-metalloendopeptidase family protein n=1 Tax=Sphingomonas rhizophila TaxID=2071607 RepID=A0A7G9S9M6_9SPHN|nr:peptidoglycan DD-metalloendopeptidase family protein [Sphingomonas rhizophila]QNN64551.1 peptidoglycan DD-metalloendopeptidase family protein [Sphingomonas rhizophila]
MRAVIIPLMAALALATTGSAQVAGAPSPESALALARAEAAAANKRVQALNAEVGRAEGEAARLQSEQLAAAAEIEAAEARIAVADAALAHAQAELAQRQEALARKRAPTAALLAGVATMGRQPPLLAIADGTSIDEIVRVRALLDTTMPVIARRSAALAAEVRDSERLAKAATEARADIAASKRDLAQRQRRFAALERQATERAAQLSGKAFGAEDRVLAGGENVADLAGEAKAAASARANARRLAVLGFSPPRPFAGEGRTPRPLPYSLPAEAPLIEGVGSVSPFGVEARGIRLATRRGMPVIVPADGRILFAGAYRDHDGVVIIDHGRGWTTLMTGVVTSLPKGARVRRGESLGRALDEVAVELRSNGRPISAALIAGSSAPLSNPPENR